MQTIRITITSEKPANVVLTEEKPDEDKGKKKKTLHKKIEMLLSQITKDAVLAGASKGDEQP